MLRTRWTLALLPLFLLALAPAGAPLGADEAAPGTEVVRLAPLGKTLDVKGVMISKRVATVACEPESYGGSLEIVEALGEGPVVEGQVLVQFEEKHLLEQLSDMKRSLALARIKLERSERDAALKAAERAISMDEAVRGKRLADEALTRFVEVDRKMREREAILRQEGRKDGLQNQREELEQLEKMYKADDLTEETEEIVLRRTRRSYERSLKSFEFAKQRHEWFMNETLPRELESLRIRVRKATTYLERLKTTTPLDEQKTKLELEGARESLEDQQESYAKLGRDRAALAVKAPFAGYVVPGVLKSGRWSSLGDMPRALEPGKKVKKGQVLYTLVDPTTLLVQTAVKEGDLAQVKKGLPATIHTSLTGKQGLEAEVASVARYGSGGSHRVQLRLRKQHERLRAGLGCAVKITKASPEEVLSLPVGCVVKKDDKHFVLVPTEDGADKVVVKVGRTVSGRIEIRDGLKAGQRVLSKPSVDDEDDKE